LLGWSIYKEQAFEKRIQGSLDTFPTTAQVEGGLSGRGFEKNSSILKNADQNANVGFTVYYGDAEVNEMFMVSNYVFIEGKSKLMEGNPYDYISLINNNEIALFYNS